MSLVYAAIFRRKKTMLCEYSLYYGNQSTYIHDVAQVLLPNQQEVLQQGQFIFYAVSKGDYNYICMGQVGFPRRIAFKFLSALEKEFLESIPSDKRQFGLENGLNKDFSNSIKLKLEYYNNPENDKLQKAIKEVDELKDIMNRNLEKLLSRQVVIDVMVGESKKMQEYSKTMKRDTKKVEEYHRCKNTKFWICLAITLLIVGTYLTLSFICGFKFDNC